MSSPNDGGSGTLKYKETLQYRRPRASVRYFHTVAEYAVEPKPSGFYHSRACKSLQSVFHICNCFLKQFIRST